MKWMISAVVLLGLVASGAGLYGGQVFDETAIAENRHQYRDRVFYQFAEDLNEGDVNAAMSHFAPDAVKVDGTVCFPVACDTPDEIRAEWENDIANGIDIDILDYRRFRNVEVARVELTFEGAPGPIIATVAVAKRGDKFVTFSALRDISWLVTGRISATGVHTGCLSKRELLDDSWIGQRRFGP